eukprot:2519008-Rhodomonas_salina.1
MMQAEGSFCGTDKLKNDVIKTVEADVSARLSKFKTRASTTGLKPIAALWKANEAVLKTIISVQCYPAHQRVRQRKG